MLLELKKIGKQKLYSLNSISDYKKEGFKILPSRAINRQLISDHWDDLLRFMVSIKLKHTTASQSFKRLSSYAKDHPLYQTLKEFGRIMKSIFILGIPKQLEKPCPPREKFSEYGRFHNRDTGNELKGE